MTTLTKVDLKKRGEIMIVIAFAIISAATMCCYVALVISGKESILWGVLSLLMHIIFLLEVGG